MADGELIAKVVFKPNCGLENTRAALILRRAAPLCERLSCFPDRVKQDPGTIPYLRDNGLFVRFLSSTPERVLLALRGSFFVESCALVDDESVIPPISTFESVAWGSAETSSERNAALPFSDRDARDEDLIALMLRLDRIQQSLCACLAKRPPDRALESIAFTHKQTVDSLRTAIARSRVESLDRAASSLRSLVSDYARRFGVEVDFNVSHRNVALDRSVLSHMEETVKRFMRSCIQASIERPDVRRAAGKPERASLRMTVDNDGPDVVCRIEHDGLPFDARAVGERAQQRGLLARPLEDYTDEELGRLMMLPRFILASEGDIHDEFTDIGEIGAALHRGSGSGTVRNTDHGTVVVDLRFPVPFTVLEVALVRTGDTRFTLPVEQIERFEAFDEGRLEQRGACADQGSRYTVEDGTSLPLTNRLACAPAPANAQTIADAKDSTTVRGPMDERQSGAASPATRSSSLAAKNPTLAIVLDAREEKHVLAADAVEGYERAALNRLPRLLERRTVREVGCIGYTTFADGSIYPVLSARYLHDRPIQKEVDHA